MGSDVYKIVREILAYTTNLAGARVSITLEIEARVPNGVPDNVVRTVRENARTLEFSSQGFEKE